VFKPILSDQALVCAYSNAKERKIEDAATLLCGNSREFSTERVGERKLNKPHKGSLVCDHLCRLALLAV
jgi:hypothetical protein